MHNKNNSLAAIWTKKKVYPSVVSRRTQTNMHNQTDEHINPAKVHKQQQEYNQ
jgi:hypothetical protein